MYRSSHETSEVRGRRQQFRHPVRVKPALVAEGPNQVWAWDATKLMGPSKWTYFHLYVIIDVFSRRVAGWCIAGTESAAFFRPLFESAFDQHATPPGQLPNTPDFADADADADTEALA